MRNTTILGVSIVILIGFSIFLAFYPQIFQQNNENNEDLVVTVEGKINQELDFVIQSEDGSNISLSSFYGEPLIIDFFATWCYPCTIQDKEFIKIREKYPNFRIISISAEPLDTLDNITNYKINHNITWFIGKDITQKAQKDFEVIGFPSVLLIDNNGTVQKYRRGVVYEPELEEWISGKDSTQSYVGFFSISISSAIGLPLFFLVGLYIALSPCLFPIMPITLLNILYKDNLITDKAEKIKFGYKSRKRGLQLITTLWSGILFSFIIFALLGVVIGSFLINNYISLNFLFGLFLVGLGFIILIPRLEGLLFSSIPIPSSIKRLMNKEQYSNLDLFVLGSGYSFIALPCSGPIFLGILPLITGSTNLFWILSAIILFAIGLYIPYLGLIMFTAEARNRFIILMQEKYIIVKRTTAILIAILGVFLMWPFFGGPAIFAFGY